MITLLNFTPNHCPQCGYDLARCFKNPLSRQDFFEGASSTCPGCGLHFAHLDGGKMFAATEGNGDLARYITADEARS